jgi:hypothetical protein
MAHPDHRPIRIAAPSDVGVVPVSEPGAVLAAVKHASRRRWPAAMLDRSCARHRGGNQAGAEKRSNQPNRETLKRGSIPMSPWGQFLMSLDTY